MKPNTSNNDEHDEVFVKKALVLDLLDIWLDNNKLKLSKKMYRYYKSKLNNAWIHIWDSFHSDEQNDLFYRSFK